VAGWIAPRGLSQSAINERILSPHHLRDRLGARTIRGGAIGVVAQCLRFFLQIAGAAVLARLLAPAEFGLIAMGATVMALVNVLTELNISMAAVQREDLSQNTASALMYLSIGTGVFAFALAAGSSPVAAWFFHDPRLIWIVVGLGAAAPLNGLGAMHIALTMRNMRWMDVQVISLTGFTGGAIVAIVAAFLGAGYWALIYQSWATALTLAAMAWIICPWRPSRVQDWSDMRSSLQFGFNITVAGILNYFHQQLDNILIGARWGSVQLGYYSRAYNLLTTPLNFLSGPLGSTMNPAMSRLYIDPPKWRAAYLDALGVTVMLGGAMACLLYGGASPIVDVVLGPRWEQVKPIFSWLMAGGLATMPMSTTSWIYISSGRTNRMLQWAMIGVPIYILSFLIGLPYGALGVAACYSVSRYVAFLPCMWMATRATNVTIPDILAVCAAPMLVAAALGLGLHEVSARTDTIWGLAATALAGLLYAGAMALAILRMPIYRRLKDRAFAMLGGLAARLALKPNGGPAQHD
jgi:PST family polysaccharide transporter